MAVSSFMKSGGIAALAFGLAMTLPAAASAQQQQGGLRGLFQQAQPAEQAQPQAQTEAQPRRRGNGGGGDRSGRRDNPQAGARPTGQQTGQQNAQQNGQRPAWVGQNRGGDQRGNAQNAQRGGNNNNRGGDANRWQGNNNQPRGDANRGQGNNQARGDNNRWQGNGNRNWNGNNNNARRWNNNWRGDNRYNWSNYRNTHRDAFRMGHYASPYRNWSYRRLGIGFMLQPLFYSNNYWIDDPSYYRLPEAYGPYRWVRYYDDALLVDIYSGRVVDVINDFFW